MEGPSTLSATVEVTTGGINITAIPQPADSNVTKINLYISNPNGTVLYLLRQFPVGTTSFVYLTAENLGRNLTTQKMIQMYPFNDATVYNGRLYAVYENLLLWSEPFNFGILNPISNIQMFPTTCLGVEHVSDGLYVTSDKAYFLAGGDATEFSRKIVSTNKPASKPINIGKTEDSVVWFDREGFILGTTSGKIIKPMDGKVAVDNADLNNLVYREQDGVKQVISSNVGVSTTNTLKVTDRATVQVRRNSIKT
jgi:hypothetical protein